MPVLDLNPKQSSLMNNSEDIIEQYQNRAQAIVNIVDANKVIVPAGRGTGKTTEITAPRSLRVADTMPRETSIITHKSYVALFTNVIPALLSSYRKDVKQKDGSVRPFMTEGIDFVVGEKDLPNHFTKPRYERLYPERSIVFANGHVLQAVAIDRPDSIAGQSVVHVLCEEAKFTNAEKFRSRVVPALRTSRIGAGSDAHKSHLHGGLTIVSDIGRVSIGESNWFEDYEKQMDRTLIEDIVSLALIINRSQINLSKGENMRYNQAIIDKWSPLLSELRKQATFYLKVSTFANRDVLGFDYFKTQKDILTMSEFLSSICSIGDRNKENLFFELFDEEKHTYDDGYKYSIIDKLNLKDSFTVDASYLKHFEPTEKIVIGYDPGNFASMVVGQVKKKENTLRIMKEFFVYPPQGHADLAAAFNAFFGSGRNKMIDLYYDRAGNKHNAKLAHQTDAQELKYELEKYGWHVSLKNLGQADIYYWQHHRLWKRLLAENERPVPKIRIDSNECPNLISAIYCCKKVPGSSPVELDKTPEKKVRIDMQAGLTPQIPSAMTYLVWGLFSRYMPGLTGAGFGGAGVMSL